MKDTFNPEQRRRLMELAGIPVEEIKAVDSTGETVHGQQLYDILPDKLYHTTTREVWNKAKKDGYLGFRYTGSEDTYWTGGEYHQASGWDDVIRRWQKPGWGVFLGTSPRSVEGMTARGTGVMLVVQKKDLNPELCYFDGDQYSYVRDRDLESVPHLMSIFYADKIPVNKITKISRTKSEQESFTQPYIQKQISFVQNTFRKGGLQITLAWGVTFTEKNNLERVFVFFKSQNYLIKLDIPKIQDESGIEGRLEAFVSDRSRKGIRFDQLPLDSSSLASLNQTYDISPYAPYPLDIKYIQGEGNEKQEYYYRYYSPEEFSAFLNNLSSNNENYELSW